jgi:phospholipid transport system substrate-binding protein
MVRPVASARALPASGGMTRPRLTLPQLLTLGLLTVQVSAWAAETPLEVIRATVTQVLAALQDPAAQGDEQRHRRRAAVHAIALPRFDAEGLAGSALGVHWRDRTAAEKEEFTRLFTDLVERSYGDTLERYTRGVQVYFDGERAEGDVAEVDTRVVDPTQHKTFSITYRLRQVEGQWRIYDVVIEHVSLVRNYRTQFARILGKSSYEELVRTIKSKLQQPDPGPAS